MDHYLNGGWDATLFVNDLIVGSWTNWQMLVKVPNGTSLDFGDRIVLYCTTDFGQTVFGPTRIDPTSSSLIELPVMPTAFIKTNASYAKNDWFDFVLINHMSTYDGAVWTITDPDGNAATLLQSDREFQLTKAGRYKIEAAVAPTLGADVTETIVTYITVE